MKNLLIVIVILLVTGAVSCADKPSNIISIVAVSQLVDDPLKYQEKIIDLYGEITYDLLHSIDICDESGIACIATMSPEYVNPKPDFVLNDDNLYNEFIKLSSEVGFSVEQVKKRRLMGVIRGQIYFCDMSKDGELKMVKRYPGPFCQKRFVIEKIISLNIENIHEM